MVQNMESDYERFRKEFNAIINFSTQLRNKTKLITQTLFEKIKTNNVKCHGEKEALMAYMGEFSNISEHFINFVEMTKYWFGYFETNYFFNDAIFDFKPYKNLIIPNVHDEPMGTRMFAQMPHVESAPMMNPRLLNDDFMGTYSKWKK